MKNGMLHTPLSFNTLAPATLANPTTISPLFIPPTNYSAPSPLPLTHISPKAWISGFPTLTKLSADCMSPLLHLLKTLQLLLMMHPQMLPLQVITALHPPRTTPLTRP